MRSSLFYAAISCFLEDFMYCLVYVYFYLRVKQICSSYLHLLKVLLRSKFNVKFVTKTFLFSLSEVAVPGSVTEMNFGAL